MEIKQAIMEAESFLIMRPGSAPVENLRTAYEMARLLTGAPDDLKESAEAMFDRAGVFCDMHRDALDEIAHEIYSEIGLTGGVVPATCADIAHIWIDDAKRLFDITFAQVEARVFMGDLISEFEKWRAKKS